MNKYNYPVNMRDRSRLKSSGFLLSYWRGQFPVDSVLFVRIVLSLIILYEIQIYSILPIDLLTLGSLFAPILTHSFVSLVIFSTTIWLVTGVLRSMRRKGDGTGTSKAKLTYVGLVIVSIMIFSFYMTPYYARILNSIGTNYYIAIHGESLSFDKSAVSLVNDTEIQINGEIIIGLANEVNRYFDKYPEIKTVGLNSNGGSIIEGKRLYYLFKRKSVNTYTTSGCASACATAFMGGKKRLMVGENKLGFHSGRYGSQERLFGTSYGLILDEIVFQQGGLTGCPIYGDEIFCKKVQATPWYRIWEPSVKELMSYRIITDFQESEKQ